MVQKTENYITYLVNTELASGGNKSTKKKLPFNILPEKISEIQEHEKNRKVKKSFQKQIGHTSRKYKKKVRMSDWEAVEVKAGGGYEFDPQTGLTLGTNLGPDNGLVKEQFAADDQIWLDTDLAGGEEESLLYDYGNYGYDTAEEDYEYDENLKQDLFTDIEYLDEDDDDMIYDILE